MVFENGDTGRVCGVCSVYDTATQDALQETDCGKGISEEGLEGRRHTGPTEREVLCEDAQEVRKLRFYEKHQSIYLRADARASVRGWFGVHLDVV